MARPPSATYRLQKLVRRNKFAFAAASAIAAALVFGALVSAWQAVQATRAKRSEVLLYKRNEGVLSKVMLPEKGAALERRIARSFQNIVAMSLQ